MGRRSVWSDESVIEISKQFVPVTDEVWRLQRGDDAECRHFREMAEQGHYGGTGGTRQGIYVLAPSGKFLASTNNLDAAKVRKTLEEGLAAWETLGAEHRKLPADWALPRRRWEDSFPTDGLNLRMFNADIGPGAKRDRLNRDHLWFSAAEARGWLGADPQPGDTHPVADVIVNRLARLNLVDNVRGQTLPFEPKDVREARVTTTVSRREGDVVTFRIEGTTRAETDGVEEAEQSDWSDQGVHARAVTAGFLGSASYDLGRGRFTAFEMVAVGTRVGRTHLNGRPKDDIGPAGIGWVFELAPDMPAERIAPAYVDVYGVSWVVDPR